MKQDVCATDGNVLVDPLTTTPTKDVPIDENSIRIIDPLIQPLIDTDELKINETNDKNIFYNLEQKSSSGFTDNPLKQNETRSSSPTICRCTGIFYCVLGSSLFTSSGFVIKQLNVDFFDALLCRFIIQACILTIFVLYKQYKIINGSISLILLQIIRVILALGGFFLFFISYRYIPLPDLTTFRYTQVIWTAIIAMIIFHERISLSTVLAITLTLIGVVCVAQPTFLFGDRQILLPQNETTKNITDSKSDKSHRVLGLCLALACAFSISASIVLNKKLLVLKIPQSILMFQYSVLCLFILVMNQIRNRFILQIYSNQSMFTWQFAVAASVSLVQLISSTVTQKAIKLEHPSIVSVAQSSDILFAIILQNFIANEKSNWLVILGSALVTTSIFIVGIHKLWKDRRNLSEEKKNNIKV